MALPEVHLTSTHGCRGFAEQPTCCYTATHLKTHTWEKSNKCNHCDFACSDASSLKRHLNSWVSWFRRGLLVVTLQQNTRSWSVSGSFDQLDLHNEVFAHFWLFNVNLVLSKNDETQILCFAICWWIYCNTVLATAWKSGGQLVSNPDNTFRNIPLQLLPDVVGLILWMMWIRRYWRVGSCRVTWVLVPECKAEQHFPIVAPRSRWVVPPFIDANLPSQVPQPTCFWKFSNQAICPNPKYSQSFPDFIAETLFFFNH